MSLAANSPAEARQATTRRRVLATKWTLLMLGSGVVLILAGSTVSHGIGYWVGNALLAVVAVIGIVMTPFPHDFYGLTCRAIGSSLKGAALSSALLVFCALVVLALRRPLATIIPDAIPAPGTALIAYILVSVPVQEFAIRGVFQSSVRYICGNTRRASVAAVIISTVVYSAIHLAWGLDAALLVIFPGVIWGIQFEREKSLAGVVLSHAIVGYICLGILPLWRLVAA